MRPADHSRAGQGPQERGRARQACAPAGRPWSNRARALGLIRDDRTIAPLALLEVQDCLQEMVSSKIGPERFRDVDFRVSDLPEKKVTDPKLAARSNQQVGFR